MDYLTFRRSALKGIVAFAPEDLTEFNSLEELEDWIKREHKRYVNRIGERNEIENEQPQQLHV